jgi:GR25 family glycosyltransferase involved in LPS biosynthesis
MKIFLINLDARTDRLYASKNQLLKLGREFTRVTAVDAKDVSDKDAVVTSGVKACWESHRKCFEFLVESNDNYALIFEDDIEINDVKQIESHISKAIEQQADLLQIGFLTPGLQNKLLNLYCLAESIFFRNINRFSFLFPPSLGVKSRLRVRIYKKAPKIFLPDIFFPGTHAYLISKNLAGQILKLNAPQFLSADDFFTALAGMRSFRIFRSIRSLASQSDSSPSISSRFQRVD